MWIYKSPEDIAKERRKIWLSFGGPFMIFILGMILCIIRSLVGPINPIHGGQYSPDSWDNAIIHSLKTSLIMAIIVYLLQLLFAKPFLSIIYPSKVMICNKCYKVKSSDGQQSCDCGGNFEDFDLWKWVDD
jgi:hypothetical protein